MLLVWPHAWACLLGSVCSPQSRGEQQCTLTASIAWPESERRNFNEPSLLEDRCHLASTSTAGGTCKEHTSRAGVLLFQALQEQRMLMRVDLQVCYSWTNAFRQRLPTNASMQPSAHEVVQSTRAVPGDHWALCPWRWFLGLQSAALDPSMGVPGWSSSVCDMSSAASGWNALCSFAGQPSAPTEE